MNVADIGITRWVIHDEGALLMKTMGGKTTKHRSRRFRRFIRTNEALSALDYAVLDGVVVVAISTALH